MGYQKGINIAQEILLELARKESLQEKLVSGHSKIIAITSKDVDSDFTFTEISEWIQEFLETTSLNYEESEEMKERTLQGLVIQLVFICSGILQVNSASKVINGNDGEE